MDLLMGVYLYTYRSKPINLAWWQFMSASDIGTSEAITWWHPTSLPFTSNYCMTVRTYTRAFQARTVDFHYQCGVASSYFCIGGIYEKTTPMK